MGNNESVASKPKRITAKDLRCQTYIHMYREGDAELPEDPDFPKRLLEQTRAFDFSQGEQGGSGTYIYYPNKPKPKMWVGQYKCLNPCDLLCNEFCYPSAENGIIGCSDFNRSGLSTGWNLMNTCLQGEADKSLTSTQRASGNEVTMADSQTHFAVQNAYAMASGTVYSHHNLSQRLALSENMYRSNAPMYIPTPTANRERDLPANS